MKSIFFYLIIYNLLRKEIVQKYKRIFPSPLFKQYTFTAKFNLWPKSLTIYPHSPNGALTLYERTCPST